MTETTQCPVDKLNLLRQLVDREHHLLNDRSNIFLVWHSILMAGFALGKDLPPLFTILPILGLAGSLIWLYMGHRSVVVGKYYRDEVHACEESLPDNQRVYTNSENWRKSTCPPIFAFPVSKYFAYLLPGLWALAWLVLLVWRICPCLLGRE